MRHLPTLATDVLAPLAGGATIGEPVGQEAAGRSGPRATLAPARATGARRDLRLDFFRGLALWFIFIDHVPSNLIAHLTFRNFGFSDATEIFVFISGYTAAIVYGAERARRGSVYMTMQVLRRCWQLYAAHIIVLVFFIAQIAWLSARFSNASFVEEMNIAQFLDDPAVSIVEALKLHYRPANLDVLPLYMALLVAFPPVIWLIARSRALAFVLSAALYTAVQRFDLAFPVYANGDSWFFNPLGWQFLFVIGAICGSARDDSPSWLRWRPWIGALAGAWLVFAAIVAIGWKIPAFNMAMEPYLDFWLYPIDKVDLDLARLMHFLAVAYLVAHFFREDSPVLQWRAADPVIRCGQHSLHVFCLGIVLSFLAHFALVQIGRGLAVQVGVIAGGIALMAALAYLMHWFRQRGAVARPAAAHSR
ncbi:MAG: OpgC family protein [Lautropia sp.]